MFRSETTKSTAISGSLNHSLVRSIALLMILGLLCCDSELSGQIKSKSVSRHSDLSFSSSVSFSITDGTKVVNEFKLVDDLGLEYDLVSMLKNKDVRNELSITDEQFENLTKMKADMTAALMPEIVNGVQSGDKAKMLEAKVKASDLEFRKQLNATQLIRLGQIENQIRLERFGAAKLVESKFLESQLHLNPEQVKSTRSRCRKLISEHKNKIESWYQAANQKLLDSLTSAQKAKLRKIADKEFLAKWMAQPLFANTPKKRFRKSPKTVSPISLLNDAAIREKIELTESQNSKINQLKIEYEKDLKAQIDELLSESGKTLTVSQRGKQLVKLNADNRAEFESQARKVLLKHQSQKLVELAMEHETAELGTVQCICNGTVSEKLSVSDDQAEKIYRTATELHRSLESRIKKAKIALNQDVLNLFPGFDEAKLLGQPVDFKLR